MNSNSYYFSIISYLDGRKIYNKIWSLLNKESLKVSNVFAAYLLTLVVSMDIINYEYIIGNINSVCCYWEKGLRNERFSYSSI